MYKKRQLLWRTIPSTLGAAASLIAVFAWVVVNMGNSVGATSTSFSFGTGGDHGNHADAQGVFEAAGQSGISFFQTNGI